MHIGRNVEPQMQLHMPASTPAIRCRLPLQVGLMTFVLLLAWCLRVCDCRGAVQGYRQRKPEDPFFGSPFWSIAVKWDGDDQDPKWVRGSIPAQLQNPAVCGYYYYYRILAADWAGPACPLWAAL
jgi:hypothetical protein